ncbi:MAG TPA: aromatic acid exporter family protein, partial [Clostridia bacterium]|nr:aromatic acid exporter family protein [Clostridia bacterium]
MNWFKNFLKSNHRMGLRIVKTGIAVTVCVAVTFFCKLNQPFFAVIATVMSMGKSIDTSFKSGKNKFFGVLLGAVIGYVFFTIAPANAGLCGMGIILTIYLCQLFRLKGAATLSCFVFSGMMFLYNLGAHRPLQFAISCTADSMIGIGIALVVNLLVMPPNYAEEIKQSFEQLRVQIAKSMDNASAHRQIDTRAVEAAIQKINYTVNLYIAEAKFLRWNDEDVFKISCRLSTYQMILDELRAIQILEPTENG